MNDEDEIKLTNATTGASSYSKESLYTCTDIFDDFDDIKHLNIELDEERSETLFIRNANEKKVDLKDF